MNERRGYVQLPTPKYLRSAGFLRVWGNRWRVQRGQLTLLGWRLNWRSICIILFPFEFALCSDYVQLSVWPFVLNANWSRKNGRVPRVTVRRLRHIGKMDEVDGGAPLFHINL